MAKQDSNTVSASKNADSIELPPETDSRFSHGIKKPGKQKKIIVVVGACLAVVLLVAVLASVFRGSSSQDEVSESQQQVATSVLKIEAIENGALERSQDNGVVWQRVEVGQELSVNDQLRTSNTANTRAEFNLGNDSWLRINRDTRISLDTNTDSELSFKLLEGRAYVRTSAADSRVVVLSKNDQNIVANTSAFESSALPNNSQTSVFVGSITEQSSSTGARSGQKLDSDGTISDIEITSVKSDAFIIWNRDRDIQAGYGSLLGILEDFEAPDLSVTSPVNGAQIEIASGSNSIGVEVAGTTESGATVVVTSSSGASAEVTANETGAFKVTLNSVAGSTIYTVRSTDRSGNTSDLELQVELVEEQINESQLDITLGAIAQGESGVALNWSFKAGFEAPDGVQVLWNKTGSLAYPVETAFYEDDLDYGGQIELAQSSACNKDAVFGNRRVIDATSTSICLRDGESYAFRVCRYDSSNDSCDIYSNEVRIAAPKQAGD